MFVIRPVEQKDLDSLEIFAEDVALGMLSLPKDRAELKGKITASNHSFQKNVTFPGHEFYLFVLEDLETKEVFGTSGIHAMAGKPDALYYFQIETIFPEKCGLPLPDEIKILHPKKETHGQSELCALFLSEAKRHEHLGSLLSRSRYLFIAEYPHRFTERTLSRLRGFVDPLTNSSPFWEGCCHHFFDASFEEAEELHQQGTAFISHFLPKYPIYISLLPKEAQTAIQKTHTATDSALQMLLKENFLVVDRIDIFDAGPFVEAKTEEIKSVKNNFTAIVCDIQKNNFESKKFILSNRRCADFRACYGEMKLIENGNVILPEEVALALGVNSGDSIRYIE